MPPPTLLYGPRTGWVLRDEDPPSGAQAESPSNNPSTGISIRRNHFIVCHSVDYATLGCTAMFHNNF